MPLALSWNPGKEKPSMKLFASAPLLNHAAQTWTGEPNRSLAQPPLPGFMSKYRSHQAPLPFARPKRTNHTS